jgi:thioredoxin-related protein
MIGWSLVAAQAPRQEANATATHAVEGDLFRHVSTIPYTGRPILLMFDTATCPYCKKTRGDVLNDPRLHAIARQFDLYNIPRDRPQAYTILGNDTTLQSLIMLYKVKVTPNIILLTSHGEKIWQLPGYVKPRVLAVIMEFVKGVDEGKYTKAEWKEYLKKNGLI